MGGVCGAETKSPDDTGRKKKQQQQQPQPHATGGVATVNDDPTRHIKYVFDSELSRNDSGVQSMRSTQPSSGAGENSGSGSLRASDSFGAAIPSAHVSATNFPLSPRSAAFGNNPPRQKADSGGAISNNSSYNNATTSQNNHHMINQNSTRDNNTNSNTSSSVNNNSFPSAAAAHGSAVLVDVLSDPLMLTFPRASTPPKLKLVIVASPNNNHNNSSCSGSVLFAPPTSPSNQNNNSSNKHYSISSFSTALSHGSSRLPLTIREVQLLPKEMNRTQNWLQKHDPESVARSRSHRAGGGCSLDSGSLQGIMMMSSGARNATSNSSILNMAADRSAAEHSRLSALLDALYDIQWIEGENIAAAVAAIEDKLFCAAPDYS